MEIDRNIIIAFLAGEATPDEVSALESWLAADPANDEEFRRQVRMWELVGALETTAGASPTRVAGHFEHRGSTARPLARNGRSARSRPDPQRTRRGHRVSWLAKASPIAALVLIGIALGVLASGGRSGLGFGANEVVTTTAEVTTLSLSDGTVVRLGPNSRLRFGEMFGPRDVVLEGQAFFAVRRGNRDPFRVHTPGGEIHVLGTRFEVQARGEQMRVLVVEGNVQMAVSGQQISVGPSQVANVSEAAAHPVVATVEDVYQATTWMGDFIAYESTPIRDVVQEFDSRFGLRIEVVDTVLQTRTVTGWFADQSPVDVLSTICLAVNARCSPSGDGFRMEL